MVRHFQSIIGTEARLQVLEQFGRLPDLLTACAGGGSNAIGLFHPFLADEEVKMVGVEAAGSGVTTDRHAATMTTGKPSVLHGMNTYCIEEGSVTAEGNHCIAAGLDYPGIGPEHSLLKDTGRVQYEAADDREVIAAFENLCRFEGIIPALESSHALAYLERLRGNFPEDYLVILNLSGRGDKDMDEFITRRNEVDRNEANRGGAEEGGPRSGPFC